MQFVGQRLGILAAGDEEGSAVDARLEVETKGQGGSFEGTKQEAVDIGCDLRGRPRRGR